MKRSQRAEGVRREAERQDALEEAGLLDDLPFTRLRRYAKEPSQVYAIRIPVRTVQAIRWLAERRDEQPTALMREWVLERLDDELLRARSRPVGEASEPYRRTAKPAAKKASRAIAKPSKKASSRKIMRKPAARKKRVG